MTRKRPSKKLVHLLAQPPVELSFFSRLLLWIFRGDAGSALTIGILFALGTAISHMLPSAMLNLQRAFIALMSLLIFGVFLGMIIVTETEKHYRNSGSRIRIVTGAIGFAAIATMASATFEGIAAASFLGAILGYFGIYWAQYL